MAIAFTRLESGHLLLVVKKVNSVDPIYSFSLFYSARVPTTSFFQPSTPTSTGAHAVWTVTLGAIMCRVPAKCRLHSERLHTYIHISAAVARGCVHSFGDIWCQLVSVCIRQPRSAHLSVIYQRGERVGEPVCTIHGHYPRATWSSVRQVRRLPGTSPTRTVLSQFIERSFLIPLRQNTRTAV